AAVCVGQRPVQREAGAVQGGGRPLLRQHRHGTLRGLAHGTEHHLTSERMGGPGSTPPPTIKQSLRPLPRAPFEKYLCGEPTCSRRKKGGSRSSVLSPDSSNATP